MKNVTSIHSQGLSFFEAKIKEFVQVDVADLDFATHFDGVFAFNDKGERYLVTNNADFMGWFKAYEDLKYGEVS